MIFSVQHVFKGKMFIEAQCTKKKSWVGQKSSCTQQVSKYVRQIIDTYENHKMILGWFSYYLRPPKSIPIDVTSAQSTS